MLKICCLLVFRSIFRIFLFFFRDSLVLLCLSWGVTAMNLLFKLLNSIESRYCQHSIKPSTTSRDFPSFQNTYRYHFLYRRLSSLLESSWRAGFCEKTPEFFWAAPHYKSRLKKVCSAERCRERSPLHLLHQTTLQLAPAPHQSTDPLWGKVILQTLNPQSPG